MAWMMWSTGTREKCTNVDGQFTLAFLDVSSDANALRNGNRLFDNGSIEVPGRVTKDGHYDGETQKERHASDR